MERRDIDPKVLEAAKKWAKDYGREVLRYAGHEGDRTYFNATDREMKGYSGLGTSFFLDRDGSVHRDLDIDRWDIWNMANKLNLTYNL